jgi:outer membrane putative beta-barrel porin/alpha-amylase
MNVARARLVVRLLGGSILALGFCSVAALAGPPYITDDPEPTELGHYENYLFATGTSTRDGSSGSAGLDLNYGGAPDLQLTAVLPLAFQSSANGGGTAAGLGNIELAAKYRFLRQADIGVDVAVFPRVFLPSGSARVGPRHGAFFLPVWVERSWESWTTFGGGGCELNRGSGSRDFCVAGWALTHQVLENLQLGAEVVHQTPDIKGGQSSTGIGFGMIYDLSEHYHLLAYAGPGLQNAAATGRYTWYASLLVTY